MAVKTKTATEVRLEESASLLLDLFGEKPLTVARVFGTRLEGVRHDPKAKTTLAFWDGMNESLSSVIQSLPDDGVLAVFFDNRYGFRYLSGLPLRQGEDAFGGLEGGDGHTLSEIKTVFVENGLTDFDVYYPFPDYRCPKIIYSRDLLPELGSLRNLVGAVARDRVVTFNEELALDHTLESGDFEMFAPCYAVVAKKGALR